MSSPLALTFCLFVWRRSGTLGLSGSCGFKYQRCEMEFGWRCEQEKNSQVRGKGECSSGTCTGQCRLDVREEVLDVFEADRDADEVVGDPDRQAFSFGDTL